MTQPAKSHEPSMEEILASIRRIIADDDITKSAQYAPEALKAAASAAPPVWPSAALAATAQPEANAVEAVSVPCAGAGDTAATKSAGLDDHSADVLDLTESIEPMPARQAPAAARPPTAGPASQFRAIAGGSDLSVDEASEKAFPPRNREERAQLISRATSAAVDSAFNTLAQTVLVHNARTIEDLVREMLRPLLKAWLDENLPGMVERLVRAEIERVSRGR